MAVVWSLELVELVVQSHATQSFNGGTFRIGLHFTITLIWCLSARSSSLSLNYDEHSSVVMMKFDELLTIIVCSFRCVLTQCWTKIRFSAKISCWCCLVGCCSIVCSHTHTYQRQVKWFAPNHCRWGAYYFWFLRFFSSNSWFLFIENTKLAHVFFLFISLNCFVASLFV